MHYVLAAIYSFLACVGFSIVFEIKKPTFLLVASCIGSIGWVIFVVLEGSVSPVMQYLYATMLISVLSELAARIWKAPATVFLFPGIIPLVPGGGLYYTMTYLLNGDFAGFAQKGIETASYAGAIAAGVSVVSSIVRLIFWKRSVNILRYKSSTRP